MPQGSVVRGWRRDRQNMFDRVPVVCRGDRLGRADRAWEYSRGMIAELASRALRRAARMTYRILPAGVCTRLACSRMGKRLVSRLAPVGLSVYPCDFGIRLRLTGEDATSSGVVHLGCMNPFETELLVKHLKPGDVFLDVGCFVDGWHSLVASKLVGPGGRVYAFEPVPEYFRQFKDNLELNGATNVVAEQLAVSNFSGESTFRIEGTISRIVEPGSQTAGQETVTVRTTTLDDYAAAHDLSSVTMLKIDTEGAEPLVLEGARSLLGRTKYLLIELVDHFIERYGTTTEQVVRSLREQGFTPYAITRRGVVKCVDAIPKSETVNVFFVRERE